MFNSLRFSRYGDKTARTLPGRVFAVIWVLIGLVISSLLIGSIATAFTSTTSPPEDSVKMLYGAKVTLFICPFAICTMLNVLLRLSEIPIEALNTLFHRC